MSTIKGERGDIGPGRFVPAIRPNDEIRAITYLRAAYGCRARRIITRWPPLPLLVAALRPPRLSSPCDRILDA